MLRAEPELKRELTARSLPQVQFGIGLHFGEVVAAHVGTTFRRQYAVVGDTVNVASRLCGVARAGEAVYSDAVVEAAGDIPDAEQLGALELKGVSRRILGYRVRATSERPGEPTATGSPPT
jgi:adenylate cyclase